MLDHRAPIANVFARSELLKKHLSSPTYYAYFLNVRSRGHYAGKMDVRVKSASTCFFILHTPWDVASSFKVFGKNGLDAIEESNVVCSCLSKIRASMHARTTKDLQRSPSRGVVLW